MYISNNEVLLRLILTTVLGGLIGIEREYHNRPAGLRTHILVSLVSTLIMIVGIDIHERNGGTDPTRLAAQVVSGIGFLGAGTIIRTGSSIKGLTTAATLWANAGIGLAVGAGFYYASVLSVVIVLVTLFVLSKIEQLFNDFKSITITAKLVNRPDATIPLSQALIKSGAVVRKIRVDKNAEDPKKPFTEVIYKINLTDDADLELLKENLKNVDTVIELTYQGKSLVSQEDNDLYKNVKR